MGVVYVPPVLLRHLLEISLLPTRPTTPSIVDKIIFSLVLQRHLSEKSLFSTQPSATSTNIFLAGINRVAHTYQSLFTKCTTSTLAYSVSCTPGLSSVVFLPLHEWLVLIFSCLRNGKSDIMTYKEYQTRYSEIINRIESGWFQSSLTIPTLYINLMKEKKSK